MERGTRGDKIMGRCRCGRVIPTGCPNCPPQLIRCPCGEMILIEPDTSEFLKEVLKKYKEKQS